MSDPDAPVARGLEQVLGVAKAMAEEVDGTSEKESEAIDRIRGALDRTPQA